MNIQATPGYRPFTSFPCLSVPVKQARQGGEIRVGPELTSLFLHQPDIGQYFNMSFMGPLASIYGLQKELVIRKGAQVSSRPLAPDQIVNVTHFSRQIPRISVPAFKSIKAYRNAENEFVQEQLQSVSFDISTPIPTPPKTKWWDALKLPLIEGRRKQAWQQWERTLNNRNDEELELVAMRRLLIQKSQESFRQKHEVKMLETRQGILSLGMTPKQELDIKVKAQSFLQAENALDKIPKPAPCPEEEQKVDETLLNALKQVTDLPEFRHHVVRNGLAKTEPHSEHGFVYYKSVQSDGFKPYL
jgi:ribosomal protein S10